jgi:hypothetical protein
VRIFKLLYLSILVILAAGGPARAYSPDAEAEMVNRFQGKWTYVSYVDNGRIRAAKEAYTLTVRADGTVSRSDDDKSKDTFNQVKINPDGRMTLLDARGRFVDLGRAELKSGDLHLMAARNEYHLIYQRLVEKG